MLTPFGTTHRHTVAMLRAALAAACYLRGAYNSLLSADGGEEKADGSSVTRADRESEAIIVRLLRSLGAHIFSEESGHIPAMKISMQGWTFLVDPLDGTSKWKVGSSTFTVILALLDALGCVRSVVVVDPLSGRVFYTLDEVNTTFVFTSTGNLWRDLEKRTTCQVATINPTVKAPIFLDVTPGFSKLPYRPISDEALGQLYASLFTSTGLTHRYQPQAGPNGSNLTLVAFGRGVAGSITTALGGPWDVAAVDAVLKAGGYAIALRDGVRVDDPRKVGEYNMLVTGATKEIAEELAALVVATLYPHLR